MTPAERFDAVAAELTAADGVSLPAGGRRFGGQALRRHGRIVAMLTQGQLAVRLPAARVDALVAAGHGTHYDAGRGSPMRQWLSLSPQSPLSWSDVMREAVEFGAAHRDHGSHLPR
ncbi:TfoX/Sxy family protein [Mangrovihabitans endophyticus]|uniref:TfoX N-terminal domain-containing protein n=1 Tax=Mangrovihabitans endophyticus TaxID=1751298 RepID=A0A8J3C2H3_9ACTN|nr:TfoX/Sxy family protein [Mangrovihabitans endophyticus]GGL00538.1 hypothetical protein GCM10012284_38730 [Mangrovihabitans endophyticus]